MAKLKVSRHTPTSQPPQPPAATSAPAEHVAPTSEITLADLAIRTLEGSTVTGAEVARLLELAECSPGHDIHDRIERLTDPEDSLTLLAGAADILDDRHPDYDLTWETGFALAHLLRHARARLYVTLPPGNTAAADHTRATRCLVTVAPGKSASRQEGR